jgi:hypothetical protein
LLKLDSPTDVVFVVWSSMVAQSVTLRPQLRHGLPARYSSQRSIWQRDRPQHRLEQARLHRHPLPEKDGPIYVRFIKG